jgi:hypothetical protein
VSEHDVLFGYRRQLVDLAATARRRIHDGPMAVNEDPLKACHGGLRHTKRRTRHHQAGGRVSDSAVTPTSLCPRIVNPQSSRVTASQASSLPPTCTPKLCAPVVRQQLPDESDLWRMSADMGPRRRATGKPLNHAVCALFYGWSVPASNR